MLAVDNRADRLAQAQWQGAEAINLDEEDPVLTIKRLTRDIGVDRVVEAVGVDAARPHVGPAARRADEQAEQFEHELDE